MQKFRPGRISKTCLTLLSLTLLTQTVLGYEENKISYLDSVSSSYLYEQQQDSPAIMDMNSIDARGIETTLKLDSSPVITNSDVKVNLSLRESDLRQALRMLADKAKLNIVFDKSVEGKITLDLNNITLNDAFLIIFKSTQLTYVMDANTITVMTLEASKDIAYTRKSMTILPIKYVNAEQVANFLNTNLFKSNIFGLSNRPIVSANPRTNQIVIFGSPADVTAVKRILPTIDTKPMVNSFKVNHTTPKEMAKMICKSLFYDVETQEGDENDDDEKVVLGSGTIACMDKQNTEGGDNEALASFKSNPLSIAYFTELGKITTYGGSVEQIETIKEFIKTHDKKQLMAYIEMSVIELNERGSKEFSNTWDLWTPFINLRFSPTEGLTTSGPDPFFIYGKKYPYTLRLPDTTTKFTDDEGNVLETTVPGRDQTAYRYSISNGSALVYQLKYLIDNGNGRVLTNPKIMVTNGKKATIDMTSDYVKSVTSQVLETSNGITSGTQKTYDIGSDEGLLIEITPFISPDGYISMNITPEFATVKSQVYGVGQSGQSELQATLLQRRDLELKNIRVRDGETLVLAGLIKETEAQTTQKMPILSDLPLIGPFFRGNSNSKTREELVMVVTPHIVKDNSQDVSEYENVYDL